MKRKVGELFNKPIVQGNENVLSSNEILVEQKGNTFSLKERVNGEIKEVSGGGGVDSSSKNFIQYFKVSKGWNKAFSARMYGVILKAQEHNGNLGIYPTSMTNNTIESSIVAYGIMPNLPISTTSTSAKNLKEYLDNIAPYLFTQTEITEEEFYTL